MSELERRRGEGRGPSPLLRAIVVLIVSGTIGLVAFSRWYGSTEQSANRARAAAESDAQRAHDENLRRAGQPPLRR